MQIDIQSQQDADNAADVAHLVPYGARVLIQPDKDPEKTAGGLHIPDSARKPQRSGLVLAVGPGRLNKLGQRVPIDIEPGQRVLFNHYAERYAGTLLADGRILVEEDDIIGVEGES